MTWNPTDERPHSHTDLTSVFDMDLYSTPLISRIFPIIDIRNFLSIYLHICLDSKLRQVSDSRLLLFG